MTGKGAPDPEEWAVSAGYHDISGQWRQAPPATVEAILETMGAVPEGPPPAEVMTVRAGVTAEVGSGRLRLENGSEMVLDGTLPGDTPTGYHLLGDRLVVVSPGVVPRPDRRMWGFATQLYAMRSTRSWGIGDFADLAELGRWAAGRGAGFTLVNPLHAATPAERLQPSPYYPGSRCFSNPIYIGPEQVPGGGGPELEKLATAGRELNADRLIDRDRVWALKSEALEAVFASLGTNGAFDDYRRRRGRPLEKFATFCALAERHGSLWREWPSELRHPAANGVRDFAASEAGRQRVRYHAWLQWLCEEQAQAAAARLGLVIDIAVGVDPSGPDTWIWQDCFAEGMRVGAPPDEFNTLGQDWGLPPFDPWKLRAARYEPWIEALRAGLSHGAGLRIDHVMGLFRLYWMPEGSDAREGVYVRYPHRELLDILALEADRAGAYVVGEDLGTVEDEVRRELHERNVLSYRVWWFEDRAPRDWPEAAMGAVTTHDLPTVAGVLTGSDLEAQRRIGMEPNEESSGRLLEKLRDRTGVGDDGSAAEAVAGVYADLADAPCLLLTVSMDDVLTVEERPNMPGTTDAWPNWCLALPQPLEEIETAPLAARLADEMSRRGSGSPAA